MAYYLLLPVLSILVVALQTTIADILFSGRLVIEISLIAVIYAGFRLELPKGSILAFVFGFVFMRILTFRRAVWRAAAG